MGKYKTFYWVMGFCAFVALMASGALMMSTVLKNKDNEEIKCGKCAEKPDCHQAKKGGRPSCPCYSPIGK